MRSVRPLRVCLARRPRRGLRCGGLRAPDGVPQHGRRDRGRRAGGRFRRQPDRTDRVRVVSGPINGQRRKVVSAQFIGMQPTSDDPSEPRPPEGRGRTFVLAVDAGSFEVGRERAPIEGAQTFVQHLDASDRVGLFVYPAGHPDRPDDAARRQSLSAWDASSVRRIRSAPTTTCRPWEIVDITAQMSNPNSFLTAARSADNPSARWRHHDRTGSGAEDPESASARRIPIARARSTRKACSSPRRSNVKSRPASRASRRCCARWRRSRAGRQSCWSVPGSWSAIDPQAARMSVIWLVSWDRRRRGRTRRSIPFTSIRHQELVQPHRRRLAARNWRAIARSTAIG